MIVSAMQMRGLSQDAARARVSMFDVNGLLERSRADLSEAQRVFAHKAAPSKDLAQSIEAFNPTSSLASARRAERSTRESSRR
jgi:malate dehydrogenase (oxaloacetate-decarboxylating)(NADP+)